MEVGREGRSGENEVEEGREKGNEGEREREGRGREVKGGGEGGHGALRGAPEDC